MNVYCIVYVHVFIIAMNGKMMPLANIDNFRAMKRTLTLLAGIILGLKPENLFIDMTIILKLALLLCLKNAKMILHRIGKF